MRKFLEPVHLISKVVIIIPLLFASAILINFLNIPAQKAQAACFNDQRPITVEGGLLTVVNSNNQISRYGVLDSGDQCIATDSAAINQLRFADSYGVMKSLYYDQIKATPQATFVKHQAADVTIPYDQADIVLNNTLPHIYTIPGDMRITGNFNAAETQTGVIFVDGNLTVEQNITYGGSKFGLMFIVGGNVNILPSVTRVDAFIVTFGDFCSAYDAGCPLDIKTDKFILNGSIIALDGRKPPKFVRRLDNNTEEAEKINFQPKYLVILRDVFARDSLIWSEIY